MAQPQPGSNGNLSEALEALLKAGLELGVAEAVRRLSLVAPEAADRMRRVGVEPEQTAAVVAGLARAIQEDSASVFQMVKEVWSRGGTKERKTAARAIGQAVGKVAPHKAIALSRDLASMARNAKEADVVGVEAIGPLLEQNPPLFDRVKQFLKDNEPWVRRAAIAGLVAFVTRKRKWAGLALEAILVVAERNEKEIRAAVRWAVRELSKVDWKETSQALADWAKLDETGNRVRLAKQYAAATATDVRRDVERFVLTNLAKFAEGTPTAAGR